MARAPKGSCTPTPLSIVLWLDALRTLSRAILGYLHKSQPPSVSPTDLVAVETALVACREAANAVGSVSLRRNISKLLQRIQEDAEDFAARVLARPPYPSLQAWLTSGGAGPPHDWIGLRNEALGVNGRTRDSAVIREIVESVEDASETRLERPNKPNTNDPRDKFIYESLHAGESLDWIKDNVKAKKEWDELDTPQGVSQAAMRYAERNGLTWPIR